MLGIEAEPEELATPSTLGATASATPAEPATPATPSTPAMTNTPTLIDFGSYHKLVAETYFDDQAWVYNGSVCEKLGVGSAMGPGQLHYVCRARDMRDNQQSHIVYQIFDAKTFAMLTSPRLLKVPHAQILATDTGPQDARIFEFRNEMWCVFNMMCGDGFRRMHVCNVNSVWQSTKQLKVDGRDLTRVEKNWTPFVHNNQLYMIYSFMPFVVLKVDEPGERPEQAGHAEQPGVLNCSIVHGSLPPSGRNMLYRGGSPALPLPSPDPLEDTASPCRFTGWLHTTRLPTNGKVYDAAMLPIPAQKTQHEYRAARFQFTWPPPVDVAAPPPPVTIEPETTFWGNQIEQVYGFTSAGSVLVNVDDKLVVLAQASVQASSEKEDVVK